MELSEDIAIRTLASGMMNNDDEKTIRKKIKIFLTPEKTKSHGRPIFAKEAKDCGLNIEVVDPKKKLWELVYELYIRVNNFVNSRAIKCIESKNNSFSASYQEEE